MARRFIAAVLLAGSLSGCSFVYDVWATANNGRLAFVVSPNSEHKPSCLRLVEVVAEDRGTAKTRREAGDDASRIGYETFWFESVDYDDACANRFPLIYGAGLRGLAQHDRIVKAKALRREVIYDVSTTTGATGYGSGRFIIHTDGHVENLAHR